MTVRETTKGLLTLSMHLKRVWGWDKEELRAWCWTLVISRNKAENTLKYRLSHADAETTPLQQFASRQAQRYWVERAFQGAKSEIGLSDDQVRKWTGWYHHMALVILATSFRVRERLLNRNDYPLLRCRDVRLLIITLLTKEKQLVDKRLKQMQTRHTQREKDMQRHFKNLSTCLRHNLLIVSVHKIHPILPCLLSQRPIRIFYGSDSHNY